SRQRVPGQQITRKISMELMAFPNVKDERYYVLCEGFQITNEELYLCESDELQRSVISDTDRCRGVSRPTPYLERWLNHKDFMMNACGKFINEACEQSQTVRGESSTQGPLPQKSIPSRREVQHVLLLPHQSGCGVAASTNSQYNHGTQDTGLHTQGVGVIILDNSPPPWVPLTQ
ncbi:hypothetical protein LTR40_009055, partial [Exophiala xenobiotica]